VGSSAGEFTEEFLLVHMVLEGFSPINKDHGDLVVELSAESGVGVDVDLLPDEAAAARQLVEAFFDDFTQVASLARVDHDGSGIWHAGRF
jgi:hypothetical protein